MQDLSVLMSLNSSKFEQGINSARKKTSEFSKQIEDSGKSIQGLAGKISSIGPAWATIYDEAKKFLSKFKDEILQSSQTIGDNWDFAMTAMTDSTQGFFNSLANGNLSDFINGFDQIISKSVAASAALDDLATAKLNLRSFTSGIDADIEETKTRMAKYTQEYQGKNTTQARKNELTQLFNADRAHLESLMLKENKLWVNQDVFNEDTLRKTVAATLQKRGINVDADKLNPDVLDEYRYALYNDPNDNKFKEKAGEYKQYVDQLWKGWVPFGDLDGGYMSARSNIRKLDKNDPNSKLAYVISQLNDKEQEQIAELKTAHNENRLTRTMLERSIDKFTFRQEKIYDNDSTTKALSASNAKYKQLDKLYDELDEYIAKLEIKDVEMNPSAKAIVLKQIENLKKQIENEEIRLNIVVSESVSYNDINQILKNSISDKPQSVNLTNEGKFLSDKKSSNVEQAKFDYEQMLKYNEAVRELSETMQNELANSISTIGNTLANVGAQINSELGGILGVFGALINGITQMIREFDNYAKASEKLKAVQKAAQAENITTAGTEIAAASGAAMSSNSKMGPYGWIAGLAAVAAIVSVMTSVIGSAKKYSTGGVVGGGSVFGDNQIIRANSGELILNHAQQTRLYSKLNGVDNDRSQNRDFNFVIEGTSLVGVLNNYNSKQNKKTYDYN
jgi:hypothetical protein